MKSALPSIASLCPGRVLRTLACLVASAITASATDIVWDFTSAAPAAAPANLTVTDVTQNNNNGTTAMLTSSSTSSGYAGASGGANAGAAARTGAYDAAQSAFFEVTLTPAANFRVTVTGINFGTRRTNTGPVNYSIRTSLDNYAAGINGANPAASTWGLITNAGLSLTSATPLTIRIFGVDGTGSASAGTANWRIDDLTISVVVVADGTPAPAITDVTPLSGTAGTPVTITGTNFGDAPAVRFNGTLATGTTVNPEGTSISTAVPAGTPTGIGPVTVTTNGGAASSPQPFEVLAQPAIILAISPDTVPENATNPASGGTVNIPSALGQNLVVTLTNDHPEAVTIPPSVTVDAGSTSASFNITVIPNASSFADVTAKITASAPGHDQGSATIKVQNADALPTSVVINKYLNSNPDMVELLVIGNGTPNSTADLRRMLIKDHSASMGSDGGGKFRFNDTTAAAALFSAVKAGTLIVISNSATSADTDPSDYVVRLGLTDTTYFTSEGGTFDIATTEMVMLKGQDAAAAGGTGAVHSLAGGAEGAQFTGAPPKKLIASGTSATGNGVTANNTTSSLADFDGTDATGAVPLTAAAFGQANNLNNNTYIRSLRGITSVDGAGIASITNGTPASTFAGKNYFPRNTPDQTATLHLVSNAGPGAITSLKITVPAAFGTPAAASVTVSGAGAGTPSVTVTGQDVSISGTAITLTDAAEIAIGGLTTPNPTAATDDGRYTFNVLTAGDAGVLSAIAAQPPALVSIPIASLRDTDANGVALDVGKTVAISGVCTEENFNATGTSAFVQDGDFGINVFVSGSDLGLVRGTRYAIVGQILQFNGLTEISPSGAAGVVAIGPDTQPTPLTVTVTDLLANAEAYEGRLIKVVALNYVSGTWGAAQTVAAADASANPLDVRIQSGSTALTSPAWPASITGIFGQFDSATPFSSGYQIMPRSDADVESLGGGTGYEGWAAAYPGIGGPSDDGDGDGVSNLLEYACGSVPDNGKSLPENIQTVIGNTLTVVWAKGAQAATDASLVYSIEASTSMAADTWNTVDVLNVQNGATSISGDYVIQPGVKAAFLRLKVVRTAVAGP